MDHYSWLFRPDGRFVLSKNGRPIQTLEYQSEAAQSIFQLISDKEIDPPTITRADIDDRSKGDFISKSFVVLQTTWFIAQCIARWSVKIPVTELEVVTLGFAVLNGITYALWWDKPQSVGVPVYLEWRSPTNSNAESPDPQKVGTLSAALGSSLPDNGDDTKDEIQGDSELEKASSPVQATAQLVSEETTESKDSFLEAVAGIVLLLTLGPLIPLAEMPANQRRNSGERKTTRPYFSFRLDGI